jgi:hypothetical protein
MRAFRSGITVSIVVAVLAVGTAAYAAVAVFHAVSPNRFDPGKTFLVQSRWLDGIGCPGPGAKAFDGANYFSATDPACNTAPADDHNQGLLLAKTGPTANYAEAFATLKDVAGTQVTELGYDIRKPGADTTDPRGSHCGAGAPRFTVISGGATYYVGCNSPHADTVASGNGWLRLRWGNGTTLTAFDTSGNPQNIYGSTVSAVYIEFDEGQDAGGAPDNFGLAVLDNIDYNGKMVGKG